MIALEEIRHLPFWEWPGDRAGESVQFRLLYSGPLQSNGNAKEKHAIRKCFHTQLKELWGATPLLKQWSTYEFIGGKDIARLNPDNTYADNLADAYATANFRFLPLICDEHGLACSLDILVLRRDAPGNLIRNGGDLDNRLKTLFDSFRRPSRPDEVRACVPEADENPFYCLVADDKLISEVKITTDRLLSPIKEREHINNVTLVIRVKVLIVDPRKADVDFWDVSAEDEHGIQEVKPKNLVTLDEE